MTYRPFRDTTVRSHWTTLKGRPWTTLWREISWLFMKNSSPKSSLHHTMFYRSLHPFTPSSSTAHNLTSKSSTRDHFDVLRPRYHNPFDGHDLLGPWPFGHVPTSSRVISILRLRQKDVIRKSRKMTVSNCSTVDRFLFINFLSQGNVLDIFTSHLNLDSPLLNYSPCHQNGNRRRTIITLHFKWSNYKSRNLLLLKVLLKF